MDNIDPAQVGHKPEAVREHLPNRRGSLSYQFEHSGFTFTATVSKFADGRLAEIFLDYERPNSQL